MSDPFDLVFGQDNATLARQLMELRRLVLVLTQAQNWEQWARAVLEDSDSTGAMRAEAKELLAALQAVKAWSGGSV